MKFEALEHTCNRNTNSKFKIKYDIEDKIWKMSIFLDENYEDDAIIYFCPFCGFSLPEKLDVDLFVEYQKYIKDIQYNHDHDEDAHRYKTSCYVCDAEKLVGT